MSPEARDRAYLWDMLDAAKLIQDFMQNMTFNDYKSDRKLQLAVERLLEIMGEAARRVSDGFKEAHQEIPWAKIIGQRNVLAHEYGEIRVEMLWVLIKENLGELITQIRSFGIE